MANKVQNSNGDWITAVGAEGSEARTQADIDSLGDFVTLSTENYANLIKAIADAAPKLSSFQGLLNKKVKECTRLKEEITGLKSRAAYLEDREDFLCALEGAGVDNWDGYDLAKDLLEVWKWKEENEDA